MVAIIAGSNFGLFESTLTQQNGHGVAGSGDLGQAKGQALVNVATGNLVLQFTDETMSGTGADLRHLRTYNSLGKNNDGDQDRWRWMGEKRLVLSGSRNQSGSYITRTTGDGHEARFTWSGSKYISKEGGGAHDSIVWSSSSSEWVFTEGSSSVVERYNGSTGWIKNSRDKSGHGFDYLFSGNRLERVRDTKSGQTLDLIYSGGRVVRLDTSTTAGGSLTRQVYYSYDSSGRLTSVRTDLTPSGNSISDNNVYTTNYTYDGTSLRVKQISQSDGTSVNFTYKAYSGVYRVNTVTDDSGVTTFAYNLSTRKTTVSNTAGESWVYSYDSSSRLIKVESKAVNSVKQNISYGYDSSGNVTSVTDGRGNVIRYKYDSNGNQTEEKDALGNTIRYTYNSSNKMLTRTVYAVASTTSPSSPQTTRYVYDSKSRLRYTVSAEGRVSETRYNSTGLVSSTIDYAGAKYSVGSLSSTASLNESQLNTWRNSQNDTKTQQTTFQYDYRGNLTKKIQYAKVSSSGAGISDDTTKVTEYVHDIHGALKQTINVRGSTKTTLSSYVYDGLGRQISQVTAGVSSTTSYGTRNIAVTNSATGLVSTSAFDSRGRLISVTQSSGGISRVHTYKYDSAGRLRMVQDAEGGRRYTFYDAAGRVSYEVDTLGAVTGYVYDADGRVTSVRAYANKVNTSSWYNGSSVTVTSPGVTTNSSNDRITNYVYDKAGRQTSKTHSTLTTTTSQYDGASRITKITQGSRVTRFFYDKDGRTIGELNAERYFTQYVYDGVGRLTQTIRYANKVSTTLQSSGSFSSIQTSINSGAKLRAYYFYDAQGRRAGTVDEKGFLTETRYEPRLNRKRIFRYMTPVTVGSSDTLSNVISRAGSSRTTTLQYDSYGRLNETTAHDATKTKHYYDSAGRLIRIIEAYGTSESRTTRTRYNGFNEITGVVTGVGSATLSSSPTQTQINTAITNYGKRYVIDKMGRRTQELGANGQKNFIYYDAEGRVSYLVNARGEVSKTTYTAFGQIANVRVYTGRISTSGLVGGKVTSTLTSRVGAIASSSVDSVVNYKYTRTGAVSEVTDAQGIKTTYTYNTYGDKTDEYRTIAGTTKTRTRYDYTLLGQVKKVTRDYGGINAATETTFDGFGRVTQVKNANGKISKNTYQSNGRIIVSTNPLNHTVKTEFDALGRKIKVWDGFGKVTTYTYDDAARKFTVKTPEGISVTTWKTRTGEVLKIVDGRGNTKEYTYDKNGNLKTSKDALGKVTTKTYDQSNRQTEIRDANGNIVRYSYDSANRLYLTAIDPSGLNLRTRINFDGQGRQISVTKGYGTSDASTTEYKYDRNSRLKQVIVDPTGLKLSTRYTYDGVGNKIKVERGSVSSPAQQVTEYTFDKLGRKTQQVRDPSGLAVTTKYRYDKAGNLTRVINARGHSTWFVYDSAGQKIRKISAQGTVTAYGYDKNGRLHHTRQYHNKLSSSTLSSLGNVVTSAHSPSSNNTLDRRTYKVYDDDGRIRYMLTAVSGSNWTIVENIYDKASNIIETRQYSRYLTESRINARSGSGITEAEVAAEISTLFPSGLSSTRRTHYAYDAENRLRFSVDALGYVSENKYDSVGNLRYQTYFYSKPSLSSNYSESNINSRVSRTNSYNRTTEYIYDKASRVISKRSDRATFYYGTSSSMAGKLETRTTYDALGNVKSIQEGRVVLDYGGTNTTYAQTTSYVYDKAGRQIKTTLAGYYDNRDGKFHRTSASDRFSRTVEVNYDVFGNAVRNKIRYKANYNSSGNVTGYQYIYQHKTYDKLNRLVHDIDANGNVTENTYDAMGNITRITRRANKFLGSLSSSSLSESYVKNNIYGSTSDRTIVQGFDSLNNKTSVTQPTGSQNYATSSNPSYGGTSYSAAASTTYTYNSFGEVVKTRQRLDNSRYGETYHYYDRLGRKSLVVDAEKYGTKTTYTVFGEVYRITEHANKSSTSSLSLSTPASFSSNSKDRKTRFAYDAMGRQTSAVKESIQLYSSYGGGNATYTKTVSQTKYNAFGEVSESRDALSNLTKINYDRLGRVSSMVEPERRVAGTGTDPFSSRKNAKPTTYYRYDNFGNVKREERRTNTGLGQTIYQHYSYDFIGNLISQKNGRGHTTYYKVDSNGRTISQRLGISISGTSAMSHTIERQFVYDKLGRQTHAVDLYTDHNGSKRKAGIRQDYNQFGEVTYVRNVWGSASTSTTSLSSAVQRYSAYDKAGRVRYSRDAAQGYTYYFYDLANRVTKTEVRGSTNSSSGARVTLNYYDKLGRVLHQRLPVHSGTYSSLSEAYTTLKPVIEQTFDRWGNVLSIEDAANKKTTYTYNHNNQVMSELSTSYTVRRESGSTYTARMTRDVYYDVAGRQVKEKFTARNGSSVVTSKYTFRAYNKVGQLETYTDATGKKTYYAYDIHGNKVATKNGVGNVSITTYDKNNQAYEKYILRGSSRVRLMRYYRDQAGRVYREYDAGYKSQYYTFDERGKVIRHNKLVGVVNYRYNAFGNKTYESQAVTGTSLTQQWTYSSSNYTVGRKTSHTRVNGQKANLTYTRFGQVDRESIDSRNYTQYTYWQNGSLRKVTDIHTVGWKGYADESRHFSYEKQTKNSEFFYDIRGKRTVEKYSTNNEWETTKRIYYGSGSSAGSRAVIDQQGSSNSSTKTLFSYDSLGRLSSVKSPRGTFSTKNGSSVVNNSTAEIISMSYQYDEFGNRRRVYAQYRLPNSSSTNYKTLYYKYDKEGRVLVEDGSISSGKIVANKNGGIVYTYDAAGRRSTEEKWVSTRTAWVSNTHYGGSGGSYQPVAERFYQTRYQYNDLGLVKTVSRRTNERAAWASTASSYTSTGSYYTRESHTYDNRGFKTQSTISGKRSVFTYNNDGRVKKQTSYNSSGKLSGITDYLSYHSTGDVIKLTYKHYDNGSYKFTETRNFTYEKTYAGLKNTKITVSSTQSNTGTGTTYQRYDHRGHLTYAYVRTNSGYTYKYFANDAQGQIIGKVERLGSSKKVQNYYYSGGNPIADIGNERVNLTPINSQYKGGDSPGSYTVKAGDTLSSIAQAYFGDANLWYVIAEANGLAKGPTEQFSSQDEGIALRIPNSNQNLRNHASTFKPYNPGEAIGDLSPTTVALPPPPSKQGCSTLAIIIIVVVAAVATVVTAGAAAVAMGAVAAGTGVFAAGTAVVTGAALAGGVGLATTAAVLGAAAIGGFVGSLAGQAVSIGFGMQEKINWRQAAAGGLTAAFGAGIGAVAGAGSQAASVLGKVGRTAGTAAANYTASYVSNKIVGLDAEFSWKGLAAAAATSVISGGISNKLNLKQNMFGDFVNGMTRSGVSYGVNRAMGIEDNRTIAGMAADAFGNALANSITRMAVAQSEKYGKNHATKQFKNALKDYRGPNGEKLTRAQIRAIMSNDNFASGLDDFDNFYSYMDKKDAAADLETYIDLQPTGPTTNEDVALETAADMKVIELEEVVVSTKRVENSSSSALGNVMSGGMKVLQGAAEVAEKYGEYEILINAAYSATKAVITGGPVKTVVTKVVVKSVGEKFVEKGAEFIGDKVGEFVTGWAQRNNFEVSLFSGDLKVTIGANGIGQGSGIVAGGAIELLVDGDFSDLADRGKRINGIVDGRSARKADGVNARAGKRTDPLEAPHVKLKSSVDDETAALYANLNNRREAMLANGDLNRPIQRRNPSKNSGRISEVDSGSASDAIDGKGPWTNQVKTADGTVIKYDGEGFPVLNDVLHVSDDIDANTVRIKLTGDYRQDFAEANRLAGINDAYLAKNNLVWHHHQDLGVMQLVPQKYHNPVSHTGGVSLYNQFIQQGLLDATPYP